MFGEAGVDLSTYPSVGVGSVCRRQRTGEIREVLEALRDRDPEVPLHGYGVKTQGLRIYGDLLASSDSMGWSLNAGKNPRLPGCTHGKCSNCLKWALRWRRGLVAGGGCEEHGEPCDGGGWCWQRQLWEMKQARNAAAAAAGLARRNVFDITTTQPGTRVLRCGGADLDDDCGSPLLHGGAVTCRHLL